MVIIRKRSYEEIEEDEKRKKEDNFYIDMEDWINYKRTKLIDDITK